MQQIEKFGDIIPERGSMPRDKRKRKYILDVSARFYPIISTGKRQSLFALYARLDGDVDKDALEKAANNARDRFPTICAKIKKGFAWHYLMPSDAPIKVFELDDKVLAPIDPKQTGGYMFRLACSGDMVRLDIFHALTDANGALEFLKAILKVYREMQGVAFDDDCGIIDCSHAASNEETEDSFIRHGKPVSLTKAGLKNMLGFAPHRTKGTYVKDGYLSAVGAVRASDVLERAKKYDASYTAYLTGVLGYCLEKRATSGKPYVIMIPVNLRAMFKSKTLRNFVTFIRVVIHPGTLNSIEEYIAEAKEQLQDLVRSENMEKVISTTVKGANNGLLKVIPLFLKTAVIRFARLFMRSRQTIIFSNPGRITLPKQLGVNQLWLQPNVSKNNVENLACVTVENLSTLAFTRVIREDDLPKLFFDELEKAGISIIDKQGD